MTISWSQTTSRSSCASTPSSRCHSRWQPNEWFALDFFAVLTEGRTSAQTAARPCGTANSFLWFSSSKLAAGIGKPSRTVTSGITRWRRSRADSAARLASTLKSFAFSWCWTSSSPFSLLGQCRYPHPIDYRIMQFHLLSLQLHNVSPNSLQRLPSGGSQFRYRQPKRSQSSQLRVCRHLHSRRE